jgi:hypothetical protein
VPIDARMCQGSTLEKRPLRSRQPWILYHPIQHRTNAVILYYYYYTSAARACTTTSNKPHAKNLGIGDIHAINHAFICFILTSGRMVCTQGTMLCNAMNAVQCHALRRCARQPGLGSDGLTRMPCESTLLPRGLVSKFSRQIAHTTKLVWVAVLCRKQTHASHLQNVSPVGACHLFNLEDAAPHSPMARSIFLMWVVQLTGPSAPPKIRSSAGAPLIFLATARNNMASL